MQIDQEEVDAMWDIMHPKLLASELPETNGDRIWVGIQQKMREISQSIHRNWRQPTTGDKPPHHLLLELYTEIQQIDDPEIQIFANRIENNKLCSEIWTKLLQECRIKQVPKDVICDAVRRCIKCFNNVWKHFSSRKKETELKKWNEEGSKNLTASWEEVVEKFKQIVYHDKHEDAEIQTSLQQFETILSKSKKNPLWGRWKQTLEKNEKNLAILTELKKLINEDKATPALINNAVREWITRSQSLWVHYQAKIRLQKTESAAHALAHIQTASFLCSVCDQINLANTMASLEQIVRTEEAANALVSLQQPYSKHEKQDQQFVHSKKRLHQVSHELAPPQLKSQRRSAQVASMLCTAQLSQRVSTSSLRSLKLDAEFLAEGLKDFNSEEKLLVHTRHSTCIVGPPGSKQKKRRKHKQKLVGPLHRPRTGRQKKPVVLPPHDETSIKKQQECLSEFKIVIENAPQSKEEEVKVLRTGGI